MPVQSQLKKIIVKRIKNLLLVQYSRFGPALEATNTARILSTCFENSRLIQWNITTNSPSYTRDYVMNQTNQSKSDKSLRLRAI